MSLSLSRHQDLSVVDQQQDQEHEQEQEQEQEEDPNASSNSTRISVERKLELLESRFTQPSLPTTDPTPTPMPMPTPTNNNHTSSALSSWINNAFDATMTSPPFTTATTATATTTTGRMSPHLSNSEHSFQFPRMNSNSQQGSNRSNPLPQSAVRSRRRPSLQSSFHSVSMAAARHMRKVAANSPVHGLSSNNTQNSNSTHTLITSNQNQQQNQQHQRVVAESPPVLVSPPNLVTPHTAKTANKPKAVRNLIMSSSSSATSTSTPTPTATTTTTTTGTGTTGTTGTTTSTSTGTTTKNKAPATTNPATSTPQTKRKSAPKRKLSSIKDKSANSNLASPVHKKSSKSEENSRSPHRHIFSEFSRDRSNSTTTATTATTTTTTTKTSKAPKEKEPPANNRRIHDFFRVAPSNNNNNNNNNTKEKPPSAAAAATANSTATTTATTNANATDWHTKCQKLEQLLQDKDEQLKAVTNNKTILHTALQSALHKTKLELQQVQQTHKSKTTKTTTILEDLLRWKSSQQAKELRGKLASDGAARLGRIVVQKVGLRAVESWEEGYATKDLVARKVQQKDRLQQLQARLEQVSKSNTTTTATTAATTTTATTTTTPNTTTSDKLLILEAKESVQRHLHNCQAALRELAQEEQALNDEKGAHIRALKRVASEDASQFRSKPKLHDRYVLHCLLGKGGFSEVWKGYDLVELREVAVKIHQLDPRWPDSKKENYTKHVSREYEIHRNVRHARIVSLFDVFEIDNNSFATVLECCNGTDLDTLLKTKKRLPERQARSILLQILSGMRYLSEPSDNRQGIIHYDLKPGNILFDETGDAKITDFGLSKIIDAPDPAESMELTSQGAGTYWYLPPECFITTEKVRISNKVDVWSIGVIYYQMLYGMRPFGEGKSQDRLLRENTMLNASEVRFSDRIQVSKAGKEFIRQCLQYDQAFRPTIAQLCENPYVIQESL